MIPIIAAPVAGALECAILPRAVCRNAENSIDNGGVEDSAIWVLFRWIVRIMMAGVALLAIIGIVYGAVLYTSAGGSAEQIKKAKNVFTNVVIGVVVFILFWVFLEWLLPGWEGRGSLGV